MIAMALVCRPALLIADEPTTALDVTVQAQILALIRDIQHEMDMSVLMITHDMGVVANVAEEVVVMYRGEVMESGTARDLFTDPRHPYLKALMRAVPRIDGDPSERLKPLVEQNAITDQPLARLERRERPKETGPLLQVDQVVKRYTIRNDEFSFSRKTAVQVTAVDRVSFDVHRGECLALVGESGCGKTTLAKMIMSAISSDEGRILFDEGGNTVDLAKLDEGDLKPFRRRIQYIFQDPFGSLNPRMTVGDLLTEPLAVHGIGDKASRRERAAELMRRVGIDPRFLNRYPHSFSGGQRQRIGIGRAAHARAGAGALRRARLGARRLDARAGSEPPEGPAGGARPDAAVHLARSGGGELHRRPSRRHVPWQARRGGAARAALPRTAASLHAALAGLRAASRSRPSARFRRHRPGPHDRAQALAGALRRRRRCASPISSISARAISSAPWNVPPQPRLLSMTTQLFRRCHVIAAAIGAIALLASLPATAAMVETPSLAEEVKGGKLPPVEQRVPETPLTVPLDGEGLSPGQSGGTIDMLLGRAKDIRMLVVYGYARLVGYDKSFNIVPDIVETFGVKEGREFTFKLRKGHKWSDGQPFTAEDFRYFWEDMVLDPVISEDGPPDELLVNGKLPKFEVIDELTVRYTWDEPNPNFLIQLAGAQPLYLYRPAHYLKQFHAKYTDKEKLEEMAEKIEAQELAGAPLQDGPAIRQRPAGHADARSLGEYDREPVRPLRVQAQSVIFIASMPRAISFPMPTKWSPTSPTPISSRPRSARAKSMLQARNLELKNFPVLKAAEERNGYTVHLWKSGRGSQLALFPNLNVKDPVWRAVVRDVRFRRALSLGIDRNEINQVVFFGLGVPSNNTVLPESPLFKPEYQTLWARLQHRAGQRAARRDGPHRARRRRLSASCPTAASPRSSSRRRARTRTRPTCSSSSATAGRRSASSC